MNEIISCLIQVKTKQSHVPVNLKGTQGALLKKYTRSPPLLLKHTNPKYFFLQRHTRVILCLCLPVNTRISFASNSELRKFSKLSFHDMNNDEIKKQSFTTGVHLCFKQKKTKNKKQNKQKNKQINK